MRGFAHALIVAIPALVGGAATAHAANTSCTGTLSGSITGDVVVPNGASCTLSNATVTGDVQVRPNASLTIDARSSRRRSAAMSRRLAARPHFLRAA